MDIIILSIVLVQLLHVNANDEKEIPELIKSRNYECEAHKITTSDGYIITSYRLVNANCAGMSLKPVVLGHGLLGSGSDFLFNSPGGGPDEDMDIVGNNLGFELAKRCYDVWLLNSRGNRYSMEHVTLNHEDRDFWDFSFEEMAEFDLPASIDYVLFKTNLTSLAYIGMSQGSATMFALLSTHQKYNDIVKPFIALAPVTSVANCLTPVKYLIYLPRVVSYLEERGGPFLSSNLTNDVAANLCTNPVVANMFDHVVHLIVGPASSSKTDQSRMSVYASSFPAGTSTKNVLHWAQGVRSGTFARFDYEKEINRVYYDNEKPPEFPLERISNKNMVLISARNDWLSTPKDVEGLRQRLKVPLLMDFVVPDPKFNHVDFMLANDVGLLVNSVVLDALNNSN